MSAQAPARTRKAAAKPEGLIPLDDAVVVLWPHAGDDPRLHIRILPERLPHDRLAKLLAIGGRCTIMDPTGTKDGFAFWKLLGKDPGFADAVELRREFGKLDCGLGEYMRSMSNLLGDDR